MSAVVVLVETLLLGAIPGFPLGWIMRPKVPGSGLPWPIAILGAVFLTPISFLLFGLLEPVLPQDQFSRSSDWSGFIYLWIGLAFGAPLGAGLGWYAKRVSSAK